MRHRVILIADSPMTLGVQFLLGHLDRCDTLSEAIEATAVLSASPDFTRVESPYSAAEVRQLTDYIGARHPAVIGISSVERTRNRTLAVLPTLRSAAPDAIFLAGGIDAIAAPRAYFDAGVDLVAVGDGELPLEMLLNHLHGGECPQDILGDPPAGFASPTRPAPRPAQSPAELPLPYYGDRLLSLTEDGVAGTATRHTQPQHVQFLHRGNAIDMYTQRGCTHKCSFCAQDLLTVYRSDGFRNSRRRPLNDVVRYLRDLRVAFPDKDFVYFWDLDFLRKPKAEVLEFAAAYRGEVSMPFFIFVTEKSVNAAGENVLRELVSAGLKTINMGIQSGSARMLEAYGRGNTPDEALRAIHTIHAATRESDVEVLYDVITYNPAEAPEDILATVRLVTQIPADGRQTVRLNTHKLSFNTGQRTADQAGTRTFEDYQDFVNNPEIYARTKSPFLAWLLGQMMRGVVGRTAIGSVRRAALGRLLDSNFIRRMDDQSQFMLRLYQSFVPRDSEEFVRE